MYPDIKVSFVFIRAHRRVSMGRRVTLADGRVIDFNYLIRRRHAIERALFYI